MLKWFVMETAICATINFHVHSWIAAEWIGLPEDFKEKKRHQKAEGRELMEKLLALFSF